MAAHPARLDLDDLPDDLREALRPRVERLGYLGEFFRCMAHQPDALLAFVRLTEELRSALPGRLAEVVPLTVAVRTGNDYERHQHERLSLTLGHGEAWVRDVEACTPDAEGISLAADDRLVQRLVLAVLERSGHGGREAFDAVAAELGDDVAVAALLLTGRYVMHALTVNALELAPPVPSPLEPS
jgi:hypothetical protein